MGHAGMITESIKNGSVFHLSIYKSQVPGTPVLASAQHKIEKKRQK